MLKEFNARDSTHLEDEEGVSRRLVEHGEYRRTTAKTLKEVIS